MNKTEFIVQIRNDHPEWSDQQIVEYANTPYLHANPAPQPTVPKRVNFTEASKTIARKDRSIIQNQLQGTYESLLANISKGQLEDVALDVDNLVGAVDKDNNLLLSPATITILEAAIAEVIAGEPDPNWQPTVYQPPYADHGLTPVLLSDLEE
jgi:hypothetical protein